MGGGLPYYVSSKDMAKNEVYVTTNLDDANLWHRSVTVSDLHWINGVPETDKDYKVRLRYRAPLVNCTLKIDGDKAEIMLADEIRAITPGQSAVIYDGDHVLGGGIVC